MPRAKVLAATFAELSGWIRTEGAFYRPRGLLVHSAGQLRRIADPLAGQAEGYGPEMSRWLGACGLG